MECSNVWSRETWTSTKASKNAGNILNVDVAEDAANHLEEMLARAKEATSILKTIWNRKHRKLGHVLRHGNFLHDSIEGKMMGKATPGRKRIELLHDIMHGKDYG